MDLADTPGHLTLVASLVLAGSPVVGSDRAFLRRFTVLLS